MIKEVPKDPKTRADRIMKQLLWSDPTWDAEGEKKSKSIGTTYGHFLEFYEFLPNHHRFVAQWVEREYTRRWNCLRVLNYQEIPRHQQTEPRNSFPPMCE